jgi:hypothetical protein
VVTIEPLRGFRLFVILLTRLIISVYIERLAASLAKPQEPR